MQYAIGKIWQILINELKCIWVEWVILSSERVASTSVMLTRAGMKNKCHLKFLSKEMEVEPIDDRCQWATVYELLREESQETL